MRTRSEGQPYVYDRIHLRRYVQMTNDRRQGFFDSGSGIVRWIDLRRAHMKLAQPNGRIVGVERHGAIVQEGQRKAKPANEHSTRTNHGAGQ